MGTTPKGVLIKRAWSAEVLPACGGWHRTSLGGKAPSTSHVNVGMYAVVKKMFLGVRNRDLPIEWE